MQIATFVRDFFLFRRQNRWRGLVQVLQVYSPCLRSNSSLSYYDCPCLRSNSKVEANNCLCFLSHVLSGMAVHYDHLSFSFCVRNLVFPRFPLLLIHRPAFSRSWRATHVCGSAFCTSSSVGDGAFCTSSSALLLRRRGRRARRRPSGRLGF